MKRYALNYSMYKKMVALITLLVIFIILVLSSVLYFNFEKIGLQMQFNANLSILSEISYSANYMDDAGRNLAAYLYANTDYVSLQNSKVEDIDDVFMKMQRIEALVTQSNNVHSVYIYNGNLQRLYSTWWRFFSDPSEFLDQDIVDLIQNEKLPHKRSLTPFLRKIPVIGMAGPERQYMNVLSYIIYDYSEDGQKIQNAIVVNLKSDYLAGLIDLLNTKSTFKDSNTFILNGRGQVVANSKGSAVTNDWKDKSHIKRVLESKEKNGYFFDILDGKKVVVTYAASDILDWKYVNITPYSEIFKDIERMKKNTYLLCFGLLIFGFSLSCFVARYLYSPIRAMMGKVEQLSNKKMDTGKINEVDFVTTVLTDTLEKARTAQVLHSEHDTIQKQKFLKSLLLNEELEEGCLCRMLEKHKIGLEVRGQYIVCNYCIDRYRAFQKKFSVEDQRLYRFAICNVASEIANRHFNCHCFEVDDHNLILMMDIRTRNAEEASERVIQIIKETQEWCDTNLFISLTAAVSIKADGMAEIPTAYKFVAELSKRRFIHGFKSLLLPDLMMGLKTTAFEHPAVLERKLVELLSGGKLEEAIEIYKKIIGYISEYSYETINSYMFYLAYQLFRESYDLEAKGYERIPYDCNSFIRGIAHLEMLEEINERFFELFRTFTDTINLKKVRRKNILVDKVVSIIESEYMDKALCQDSVASRLNISRDYLGKIFRDAYAKSFADYLTEVRMQKAVELLNLGKNVTEILEEIGWVNKNYFYTTFKQKYGMTTSEFKTQFQRVSST
ncbi:MAG: AraC family transcriptional regulator [Clostridia bacterium]|nr:AraC family transcriptional regulator [Clostridia bacterium]